MDIINIPLKEVLEIMTQCTSTATSLRNIISHMDEGNLGKPVLEERIALNESIRTRLDKLVKAL